LMAVFVLLALLAIVPLAAALSVIQVWWTERRIGDRLCESIAHLQASAMGVEWCHITAGGFTEKIGPTSRPLTRIP
jgi:hypothetical protein